MESSSVVFADRASNAPKPATVRARKKQVSLASSTSRLPWTLHPEKSSLQLNYDYLANSSLNAIEFLPGVRRHKEGDRDFLLSWWLACRQHELLDNEMLMLDAECEQLYASIIGVDVVGTIISPATSPLGPTPSSLTKSSYVDLLAQRGRELNALGPLHSPPRRWQQQQQQTEQQRAREQAVDAVESLLIERLRRICCDRRAQVLCVGDVHGCVDELRQLVREAEFRPGDLLLLLGDMVAKGPSSLQVLRLVREVGGVSVRGNHDHEVVRQLIEDRRHGSVSIFPLLFVTQLTSRQPLSLTVNGKPRPLPDHQRIARELNERDADWLRRLPYFIFAPDLGSLFVHAGMLSSTRLGKQSPWVMMNMRSATADGKVSPRCLHHHPWAQHWSGPLTLYFGHDAARGLQLHPHAVGLDTGCVYGERLTAISLPSKRILSVPARRAYIDSKKSQSHKSLASSRGESDASPFTVAAEPTGSQQSTGSAAAPVYSGTVAYTVTDPLSAMSTSADPARLSGPFTIPESATRANLEDGVQPETVVAGEMDLQIEDEEDEDDLGDLDSLFGVAPSDSQAEGELLIQGDDGGYEREESEDGSEVSEENSEVDSGAQNISEVASTDSNSRSSLNAVSPYFSAVSGPAAFVECVLHSVDAQGVQQSTSDTEIKNYIDSEGENEGENELEGDESESDSKVEGVVTVQTQTVSADNEQAVTVDFVGSSGAETDPDTEALTSTEEGEIDLQKEIMFD